MIARLFRRLVGKFKKTSQVKYNFDLRLGTNSLFRPREYAEKPGAACVIGDNSLFCGSLFFDKDNSKVIIGDRTYVAGNLMCATEILIGNDVLISSGGAIFDHDSHALQFEYRKNDVVDYLYGRKKDWSNVNSKRVEICNKAWVGYNVIILKGVVIGEGSVVAAGSVVTKNVDPYTVVAGNPARFIKKISC